jgi:hypothetical protein
VLKNSYTPLKFIYISMYVDVFEFVDKYEYRQTRVTYFFNNKKVEKIFGCGVL